MVSDKEHEPATVPGEFHSLTIPSATGARYDAATSMVTVDLNRGFSVSFHKSRSQVLHAATDEQLSDIDIWASGRIVFFPKLDEGFTITGMLAGRFGNRHWESRWADEHGIEVSENTLPEPTYAVFVEMTAAQLNDGAKFI